MDTTTATAKAVEAARAKARVAKNDLANKSGIPYTTLLRRLSGLSPFTVDEIARVSSVLGVGPERLVQFRRAN